MPARSKSAALAALLLLGVAIGVVVGVAVGGGSDRGSVARAEPGSHSVDWVVDGDTLRLRDGRTVRLVGIDAPERGECGYEAAGEALADVVMGERVRLSVSDEDTDQYGRLLRYVDVGSVDAGLRLIERGLAVARYDSRDGYGRHPREAAYIAADADVGDVSCSPS